MEAPTLGERIRSLRLKMKLSLRELARRAEVSPSFLSEIETGRRFPSDAVLERLASELGVSATKLRKLDLRSHLSELRQLLSDQPAWGPVFQQIARAGKRGELDPEELLKWVKRK